MREVFRDTYSRSLYLDGKPQRRYGFGKFLLDLFMTAMTSGLWIIWIFVREMRKS